jgi:hypothetical protein
MRALVGIKQDPVHIPALTAAVPTITTTVIAGLAASAKASASQTWESRGEALA